MAPAELAGDEGRNSRAEVTLTQPEKTDITSLAGGAAKSSADSDQKGDGAKSGESAGSGEGDGQDEAEAGVEAPKKSGFIARLGLDVSTLALMFKGSLPPVIAIAIYQATPVAQFYGNLGYLMAIISVISLAVLPRGKFIQTLLLNVLATCVGTASLLLILWTSIQARLHTAPPQPIPTAANPTPYNSSQSAVCGIWLFFNIWLVNLLRAKLPAFNIPVIVYSILVNIGATQGAAIPTMAAAQSLAKQLFLTMLSGMGLAAGVSLLVFPISGRDVSFAQSKAAIGLIRGCIKAQKKYLTDLEKHDMFKASSPPSETSSDTPPTGHALYDVTSSKNAATKHKSNDRKVEEQTLEQKDAQALLAMVQQLRALGGKMHADLSFAKRDIAWCKLDAKDLGDMYTLFRYIYIPVLGMTTVVDIFDRAAKRFGWDADADSPAEVVEQKKKERQVWLSFMQEMHAPFDSIADTMDQALEHAGYMLEIVPRPKRSKKDQQRKNGASAAGEVDVEAQGGTDDGQLKPGDLGFANVVKKQVDIFYNRKVGVLRTWIQERRRLSEEERKAGKVTPAMKQRATAQLYIVLYVEKLMLAAAVATHHLAAFADEKVKDGTMSHKRLIFPSQRRLHRWLLDTFSKQDSSGEHAGDIVEGHVNVVYMGDSYNGSRDPEHLPATNTWQRIGDVLRKATDLLGSDESFFGVRVACATMTVAIVAYLESTQTFFIQQRLVWAMIITALGMTPTSGQSIFGFLLRVGGTLIAMVAAYIIWYIVDEKTAGAIVFLWLFIFVEYYFFIKFPRFLPVALLAIVTQSLIIGYELQVRKIGEKAAESTGQPYYPTYILAPYRLATVVVGSLVAFIWTVFPKPLTERTTLRKDLSTTLHLLANYFSVINTAMKAQMEEQGGDIDTPGTPAHQLQKVRSVLFGKLMLLIPGLSDHASWQSWEPRIGGRFPIETYEEIIRRSTSILDYLTLMSYSLTWKPIDPEKDREEHTEENVSHAWLKALREVLSCISPMHHTILSTLALLSNSLLSGRALPPFMPLPEPYAVTRQVLELNSSLRDAGHVMSSDEPVPMNMSSTAAKTDGHGIGRKIPDDAGSASGSGYNDEFPIDNGDLLNPDNMEQPGYTEFAVMQVCGTLLCGDLEQLVKCVSSLVGVVDFSFRIDDSTDDLTVVHMADTDVNAADKGGADAEGLRRRIGGNDKADDP